MKKILMFIPLAFATGCLNVVRVPTPTKSFFSDDGVCTNRTWTAPLRCIQADHNEMWSIYPTIYIRLSATCGVYGKPINENLKGEELYNAKMAKRFGWIPLTILWLTSPFDAVIDTIALPFDLNVKEVE